MMWRLEWIALSARIGALLEAGTYFLRSVATGENDNYGMTNELLRNGRRIAERVKDLAESHGFQIPDAARESATRFVALYEQQFPNTSGGLPATQGALTLLASFRGEFNHLVNDTEAIGRNLVARALTHLQRSIVADTTVKDRWKTAFQEGETACEKLGATHLLLHGVWAFKAIATGERTDLVLGVPLEVTNEVRSAAEALVLTEWKVVRKASELNEKADQAYQQAKRYSSGILAGFELASRRYLVIVSEDLLSMPKSPREGDVVYEYVNVAVSPRVPSASATTT